MTDNDTQYWYKLISKLKSKGKVSNGLTLPYIIGAYELIGIPFKPEVDCINRLLNDIVDSDMEQIALMQKCPQIGEYVIGLDNKEFCNSFLSKEINFQNTKGEKTLFITQNATDLGAVLNKVCDSLNSLYFEQIKEKKFSWDNSAKIWRKFNEEEKELILSL